MEVLVLEAIEVAYEESVGGDDEMRFGDADELLVSVGAVEVEGFEFGGEFFGFGLPVAGHRSGGDDEGGGFLGAAPGDFGLQVREGLDRFAEPHIVGENAVEGMAGEKLHPVKAFKLVVPQGSLKGLGRLGLREFAEVVEAAAESGEVLEGLGRVHLEFIRKGGGLKTVERFVGRVISEKVVQGLGKTQEAGGGKSEEGLRVFGVPEEGFVVLAEVAQLVVEGIVERLEIEGFQEGGKKREKRLLFAFGGEEGGGKAEPVDPVFRILGEAGFQVPVSNMMHFETGLVRDGDLPALFFQPGDAVLEKLSRSGVPLGRGSAREESGAMVRRNLVIDGPGGNDFVFADEVQDGVALEGGVPGDGVKGVFGGGGEGGFSGGLGGEIGHEFVPVVLEGEGCNDGLRFAGEVVAAVGKRIGPMKVEMDGGGAFFEGFRFGGNRGGQGRGILLKSRGNPTDLLGAEGGT